MKPDFPSLADEIAESHPDMNIKVAAFTESEKSSNINDVWNKCIDKSIVNGFLVMLIKGDNSER